VSIDRVTDAELVERARHGDAAAFGELVDRHRNAVYRAALAALRSPADAEDAAQDAFVTAFRRLSSFRGEASFKTWLLTITWNQAINHRRSAARWWRVFVQPRAGEEGAAANEEEHSSADPSPEQALASSRMRSDIVREIRALPAKLRDALLLAQAGEYRYEDIGAMLNVPVGTIKWRVSEARRLIRRRLRARGYSDVG